MQFLQTSIFGFQAAFHGMRNPLNSWNKADSLFGLGRLDDTNDLVILKRWEEYDNDHSDEYIADKIAWLDNNGILEAKPENDTMIFAFIGPNDMNLAKRLVQAGSEHCKFLRMIHVQADISAPRYVWSEFDTYHYNTKNSCSTMHTLLNKNTSFTPSMFAYDIQEQPMIEEVCRRLNVLRDQYLAATDAKEKTSILTRAKQILPESFIQLRTVDTNYAELRNMYFQRRHHRLTDWNADFTSWVKNLPYAKELITYEG